jgi:hypothetical protein
MQKTKGERRTGRRRELSALRTVGMGVVLIILFSVWTIGVNLVLKMFMTAESALLLSVAACIGAAVVLGMWVAESVIERQTAHVHGHIRKALER